MKAVAEKVESTQGGPVARVVLLLRIEVASPGWDARVARVAKRASSSMLDSQGSAGSILLFASVFEKSKEVESDKGANI